LGKHASFQCPLPADGPKDLIFFYEALTVYSAVCLGAQYGCDQIAVYSDNTNTVNMFYSLRAGPAYNSILMSAIDFGINNTITAEVDYVPGMQNIIADHLSRFQNAKALQLAPKLQICNFQTPWDVMGAVEK
jgi:hypothetical protein